MVRASVIGLGEARRKLAALGPNTQAAFERSIVEQLHAMMVAAQNAVPIYSGALRSTAFLRPRRRKNARWWEFGYRSPYAAFVHDHPNAHTNEDGHPCACYATIHRPVPGMLRNGQGYKWLERTVKARGNMVAQAIEAVRRAIASGTPESRPADPTLDGTAVGALPRSATAARRARNRSLIDAGLRNAGGGGGGMRFGLPASKKTEEEREAEREEKRRQTQAKRAQAMTLREYMKAMLELAAKGGRK